MNLDECVISLLDQEINTYDEKVSLLPNPSFSRKHHRIMRKTIRATNGNITGGEYEHGVRMILGRLFSFL